MSKMKAHCYEESSEENLSREEVFLFCIDLDT